MTKNGWINIKNGHLKIGLENNILDKFDEEMKSGEEEEMKFFNIFAKYLCVEKSDDYSIHDFGVDINEDKLLWFGEFENNEELRKLVNQYMMMDLEINNIPDFIEDRIKELTKNISRGYMEIKCYDDCDEENKATKVYQLYFTKNFIDSPMFDFNSNSKMNRKPEYYSALLKLANDLNTVGYYEIREGTPKATSKHKDSDEMAQEASKRTDMLKFYRSCWGSNSRFIHNDVTTIKVFLSETISAVRLKILKESYYLKSYLNNRLMLEIWYPDGDDYYYKEKSPTIKDWLNDHGYSYYHPWANGILGDLTSDENQKVIDCAFK